MNNKYDRRHSLVQSAREQQKEKSKEDAILLVFFFGCVIAAGLLVYWGVMVAKVGLHLF